MTAPSPLIETLVNRARELFSLPRVAMDVLELTKDPKVDARLLKDCIENDPALTSKLLRVVNSSLFGLSGEVSDLNQALALLGVKPLKLLVLGFSLPDGLFTGIAGDLLRRYWQHTLTKAVAAREICQTLWKVSGDEAFLCGLLQDIGQLVLIQDLGKPYVTFLRKMQDEEPDLLRLETRALGFDHTELTSRLLAHWNLPRDLVEAIARPRSADAIDRLPPEKQPVTQILHLAELIAQLVADAHTVVLPELLDAGRRYRGLTPTQLESLIDRLQAKVEQLAEVLTLTLPDDKDYREVLVQAHLLLATIAADAAGDLLRDRAASDQSGSDPLTESDEVRALADAAKSYVALTQETAGDRQVGDAQAGDGQVRRSDAAIQSGEGASVASPAAAEIALDDGQASAGDSAALQPRRAIEDDPVLLGRVTSAVAAARRERQPLSLLLVELDGGDDWVFTLGLERSQHLFGLVESACRNIDHEDAECTEIGDARFALMLPRCERHAAVELGNRLLGVLRSLLEGHGGKVAPTLNAGVASVALPPKNFPPGELIASAGRCLYAARSAGGDSLKSLEIF